MRIVYLVVLCSLFISCNRSSFKDNGNGKQGKLLDLSSFQPDESSRLISTVDLVDLELTKESLIGKVDKLICLSDRIAILDNQLASVLFFDYKGYFISKIDKEGNGNGEYSFLNDMDVDSQDRLHLLDLRKAQILKFDVEGNYLGSRKFGFKTRKIACVGRNDYLFDQGTRRNDGETLVDLNYKVIHWDLEEDKLNGYFGFTTDLIDQEGIAQPQITPFFKSKPGNIKYVLPFSYEIFSFDESTDKVIPDYFIEFGKYAVPEEYFQRYLEETGENDVIRALMTRQYAHSIGNVYESENSLVFNFKYKSSPYFASYSKNDNSVSISKISVSDLDKLNFLMMPSALGPNGSFVSVLNADAVQTIKDYASPESDQIVQQIIGKYKPEMNPLLIFWTLDDK